MPPSIQIPAARQGAGAGEMSPSSMTAAPFLLGIYLGLVRTQGHLCSPLSQNHITFSMKNTTTFSIIQQQNVPSDITAISMIQWWIPSGESYTVFIAKEQESSDLP